MSGAGLRPLSTTRELEARGSAPVGSHVESPYTVVLVDQSQDSRDFARDSADARLTAELNEGNGLRRFVKGIWKGNIARDYYRQKYIREAQAGIEAHQDVLVHEVEDAATRHNAMTATIERFQSEYDELIHDGEQRRVLAEGSELAAGVKALVEKYVSEGLSDEAFQEERTRFIQAYQETHGEEMLGEGLVKADNMLSIAQSVRGAVEHGESLEGILGSMKVVEAEARTGVRTQAKYDKVDAAIDRLNSTKIGSLVGPEVVAAATTSVASILRLGSAKAIGAAAMTIAPGVGAGIWAGIRERKRVGDERTQHAREVAQGKVFEAGAKRREDMEQTRYETRSAVAITSELYDQFDQETLDEGGAEALRTALDALAAAQTRVRYSDSKNIDLISYTDVARVAEERLALDLAIAQHKVAARDRLTPEMRATLGLAPEQSVDEYIEGRSEEFIETFEEDMSQKDIAFRKLRRRRMLAAGAIGAASGLTLGIAAQEIGAMVSSTRSGLVEQAWNAQNTPYNGTDHLTLLHGLVDSDGSMHRGPSSEYTRESFGEHGVLEVSNDHSVVRNEDGTINLVDANGNTTIQGLAINPDGHMPDESRARLQEQGMTLVDQSYVLETVTVEEKAVSVAEFVENHKDETTHITRDFWYDNDTAAPVFEKNELGLHWSGSGVSLDGGFGMNIGAMSADGSYHGGQNANWTQQAQGGTLKLAISASVETQAHVFMVDINPDGSVAVDPNSPAAKFFANENGQAVFKGQYAEVVQLVGTDANGVEHVRPLATLVGSGDITTIQDRVETVTQVTHPEYKITTAGYETSTFTEMAPVLPVTSRRSLERTLAHTSYYAPGYMNLPPEQIRQLETDRMPLMRSNPSVRVPVGDALRWHDSLTRKKDPAYAREVDAVVAATPRMAQLSSETKAVVTIPVGAAVEADNIYHTLSLYGQQDPEALKQTEILLHVNWIDAAEADPAKKAAIDKTKVEIQRAMADYPQLQLSTFETVWEKEKIDSGEYGDRLIGHVSQRMYDVAMAATRRAIAEGRRRPDDDILVIKNDADALGMDRRYLGRMISTFEAHPENDTFTGGVRWGTHRYKDLPGLGFVTNFLEVSRIAAQRKGVQGFQSTFGVNAAVRMSTFAAVGGIGHYTNQKHSAADDLAIGERVAVARNATPRMSPLRKAYVAMRRKGLLGRAAQVRTYGATGSGIADNTYHRHVAGASIDSDADRFEAKYVAGLPITAAWDGVNAGGHQSRTAGLKKGEREDLRRNPDMVIERVEANLSSLMTHWMPDEKQVRAGLAVMLPGAKELGGVPAYTLTKTSDGTQFKLTPQGKRWLIRRLQYDGKGRRDHYGDRQARQLYGRINKGAGIRKVKRPTAPLIGGKT